MTKESAQLGRADPDAQGTPTGPMQVQLLRRLGNGTPCGNATLDESSLRQRSRCMTQGCLTQWCKGPTARRKDPKVGDRLGMGGAPWSSSPRPFRHTEQETQEQSSMQGRKEDAMFQRVAVGHGGMPYSRQAVPNLPDSAAASH